MVDGIEYKIKIDAPPIFDKVFIEWLSNISVNHNISKNSRFMWARYGIKAVYLVMVREHFCCDIIMPEPIKHRS